MIIWGSVGREVDLGSGEFHCPHCGTSQFYSHIRLAQYFTLYFIPLFQTQNHGEYVKCRRGGVSFDESVLDRREAENLERPQKSLASVSVGDRVLAQWSYEHFYYPGKVVAAENGRYQIQYDDGESAWVTGEQIALFDIAVGNRVFARWKDGRGFYPGIVDEQDGDAIHIRYDDGDQEWTTFRVVRVERKKQASADAETHFKRDGR